MGLSWKEYASLPVKTLMAIREGYEIRIQKRDANFRTIGWLLANAFGDKEKLPDSESSWWSLPAIDAQRRKSRAAGKRVTMDEWKDFINKMK